MPRTRQLDYLNITCNSNLRGKTVLKSTILLVLPQMPRTRQLDYLKITCNSTWRDYYRVKKKAKEGVATRGLPRGSPILVLLSPKHA